MITFKNYIIVMSIYSFFISTLEYFRFNKYKKVRQSNDTKRKILLYLSILTHSYVFFFFYLSIPFIIYYKKTVPIRIIILFIFSLYFLPIHWALNNNKCGMTEYTHHLADSLNDYYYANPFHVIMNHQKKFENLPFIFQYIFYMLVSALILLVILFNRLKKINFNIKKI